MNRKKTREQNIELDDKIRKYETDDALSSDFIVGFAGESEEDFQETITLVERINYASSFSFKYSPRPNTVGAKMPNQIEESIKDDRLVRLQSILDSQQVNFNRSFINKKLDVLIENPSSNNDKVFFGRSPYLQAVVLEGNVKVGDIVSVDIVDANLRTLKGIVK